MTLVSSVFASFARAYAQSLGMPDLRTVVLPHPLADKTYEQLRPIVAAQLAEIYAACQ